MIILTALAMTLMTGITALADSRYSEREIREIAQRNGYECGFREGREDRRDWRSFNFRFNRIYREARYGYRDAFDDEEDYRQAFRRGFENGYRNGYGRGGNGWGGGRWDDWGRDDCDVFDRYRSRRRR
jgi:flagellar biosynthesis/type III secretory pathway protein FliH